MNHKRSSVAISVVALMLLLFSSAQAAGSLALQSLYPGASVPAGVAFSLSLVASGFTNPNFLLEDSFGGTTLSSANINSSGHLSWTPTANDIGTHALTITAGDSSGGTSVSQIIIVTSPTMTLSSLSPSATINAGMTVTFSSAVPVFSSRTYSVSDAFGGTVTNANINSAGYFSWVPSTTDVGIHAITVTATDALGHSTSAVQSITVNPPSSITIGTLSPGVSVPPNQRVTFTTVTSGFSSPIFSIHDLFSPTTVSSINLDTSGNFSWTPFDGEIGVHSISVTATDRIDGHSLSVTQVITVQPLLVTIQGLTQSTVPSGGSTYFTVIPKGFSSTTYSVSDNFVGSTIANSNINSLGYFFWTPGTNDVGTHVLTLSVNDTAGHTGSTTQQIIVRTVSTSTPSQTQPVSTSTVSTITAVATTTAVTAVTVVATTTQLSSLSTLILQIQTLQAQLATLKPKPGIGTVTVYQFVTPLALGSSGTAVAELQKRLAKEGVYTGPINGKFGSLTKTAVMKYQAKHNLARLGNVGPGTRAALNAK